jgi:hypothetical protein
LKSLQETVLNFFDKIANKVFEVASDWFTNQIFGKAGKFGDKGSEGNLFNGSKLIQSIFGGGNGEESNNPSVNGISLPFSIGGEDNDDDSSILGNLFSNFGLGGQNGKSTCCCDDFKSKIGPDSIQNLFGGTSENLDLVTSELFQLTNVLGGDQGVNGLFSTFGNLLGNLSGGGGLSGLLGGGGGGIGGLLGSLFGGGGGSGIGWDLGSSIGSLDGLASGIDWGGIASSFSGLFYKGGIPNFADGGMAELAQLGAAVVKSAQTEKQMSGGNQPILGMFNAGEAILNPKAVAALGGKYGIDKLNSGSYRIDTYAGGGTFSMDSAPSLPTPKLNNAPMGSSVQSLEVRYVSDSSGTKFISQDDFEKAMAASEERSSSRGAAIVAERLQNSSSARRAYGF